MCRKFSRKVRNYMQCYWHQYKKEQEIENENNEVSPDEKIDVKNFQSMEYMYFLVYI